MKRFALLAVITLLFSQTSKAVIIDASAFASFYPGLQMQVTGHTTCLSAAQQQNVNLAAGYYQLNFCSVQAEVSFYVDANGLVVYHPSYEPSLNGSGTNTLEVVGQDIKFDASYYFAYHPTAQFKIDGLTNCSNTAIQSIRLIPGNYQISFCNYQASINVTINNDGTVSYSRDLENILTGAGQYELMIKGYWITHDATALGNGAQFQNTGLFSCSPAQILRTELMLPGYYEINLCNSTSYYFEVSELGTVQIPSAYSQNLTGNGTSTVVVHAAPSFTLDAGTCATVYAGYGPTSCTPLQVAITGGTAPFSYLWSTGSTSASITVCPNTTTVYSVTVTDATGASATAQVTVNVINLSCGNNGSKVLVCHIPPGNPNNPQTICIAPSAVAAHLAHGDVLGSCSSVQPCSGNRLTEPDHDFVSETNPVELLVYPNPAQSNFTFEFSSMSGGNMVVSLISADGKAVKEFTYQTEASLHYDENVSLEGVAPGYYFLRISGADGTNVTPVTIE